MGTALAAYIIAWLFVSGFVGRLAIRQQQLDSRLAELESRLKSTRREKPLLADAA